MKNILYSAVGMTALICSSSARAQQADTDLRSALSSQDIVVTGSRIARNGFDNPTPTTIIGAEQIARTGLNNIGDILLQSPQIGVGLSASNDNFQRDLGSSFINLRGLGVNRTLVLVDGRRRVSGSRDGSQVDVSAIPSAMVDRVEIITGGASAVYGADAVSGVVNIILKENFQGFNLTGRSGISDRGDAATYMVSATGGGKFADGKGSARFGLTYQRSDDLRYTDRDYAFGAGALGFVPNPANTGPADGIADFIAIKDPRYISSPYVPTFVVGGKRYLYDNGLVPQRNTNCFGSVCSGGPDGYDSHERNLRTPSKTFSAMAGVKYEIVPAVTAFVDFEFAYSDSNPNGQSFFDTSLALSRDNPTIPAAVTALLDANRLRTLTIGYEGEDIFGNKQYTDQRYTYTAAAGVRGKIANFNWESYLQYGRRHQEYDIANTRIESRFYEAVDAIIDPGTGQTVCRSVTARAAGCVPINLFMGALTPAEKAYFEYTFQRSVTNEQTIAGSQATGSLLDLPAGPLGVAVGLEYRKDKLRAFDDGLGARGLLYRTDNGGAPISASTSVAEVFGEVVVPVLKDFVLADTLQVEGAVRYSHYDTVGNKLAWKLGADWAPIKAVRLRFTRSRSVRAPNIAELFSPVTRGTLTILADPCDAAQINLKPNRVANCRALGVREGYINPAAALAIPTTLGGNPDLKAETSNSWTGGVVVNPLTGLHLSVDYWSIKIDRAVETLDGNAIINKCVDSTTINNSFCPLVTRGNFPGISDPSVISNIDLRQVNVGARTARGVDIAADYSTQISDIIPSWNGRLSISATATYLAKLKELVDVNDPSSLLIDSGEYSNPSWRGSLNVGYSNNRLSASWNVRYIGRSSLDVQQTSEYFGGVKVNERFYHDVFASYSFEGMKLQLGVNNLFDRSPPRTPYTYAATFGGSLYDNIGRFFYLGFSKNF